MRDERRGEGKGSRAAELAARLVKAMGHPARIQILEKLKYQPTSVADLQPALGLPLPNVSYHFNVLSDLGCIEEVSKEPVRGAMKTIYRTIFDMLLDTPTWERLSPAVKAKITDAGLASLIHRVDQARRRRRSTCGATAI